MITASQPNKNMWRIIIGGTIGNLTEWYNFLLYGFLAAVISKEFFPFENELLSLTLTFTVFALSFIVRPLGGILFGWIGDTYGRQKALVVSLVMIGIPTFLIGCLPNYKTIGIASPILLCIFRILQGVSAGGEHTGSAIYMAELAPAKHRTLWVATVPTSAALGILFSSAMALLIVSSFNSEQLSAWGWRLGYWVGTLLCVISILLRVGLPETPDFLKTHAAGQHNRYPFKQLITDRNIFRNLITVFFLASAWGILYQILFIWMPTYLTHFQHLTHSNALFIDSLYILIFAGLLLCVGYFADRINRKFLLRFSSFSLFVLAIPIFLMLSSGKLWQIYLALGIFTFLFSIFLPVAFVSMVESFDVKLRYTGLSLGFNFGLAIFGGTCPLVVTWLIEVTSNTISPAFYMMLAAIIILLTSFRLQDKRGQNI